jgi:hypothetical protein
VTTRVPVGAAGAPGSFPDNSSLLTRLFGVIRRPEATFRVVARRPQWVAVVVLTLVASAAPGVILAATETGRLALIDQWERAAHAFGLELTDAGYSRLIELSEYGLLYAAAAALLMGPGLSLGVAAGIYGFWGRQAGPRTSFTQVFAVVSHAGVLLALRQMIAAPITFARETTTSAMSLGAWLSTLAGASPLTRFLGVIDIFVVWWAVVLAIGVGVIYARRARPVAAGFVGAYTVLALMIAGAMAVAGGHA